MKPAVPPTASRAGAFERLLEAQPLALTQPVQSYVQPTNGGLSWWERHAIGGWLMFVAFGVGMIVCGLLMLAVLTFSLATLLLLTVGGLIAMLIQPLRRRFARVGVH